MKTSRLLSRPENETQAALRIVACSSIHIHAVSMPCALACRVVERSFKLDIDGTDENGRTALMWASELGHVSAVQALLRHGADRHRKEAVNGRCARASRLISSDT